MQATPSVTVSYQPPQEQMKQLEIPSKGLVMLEQGEENRRVFGALVAEATRRRELDNTTYSLVRPQHLITSPLPPTTVISLHAFSRSSQPLYQFLSLEESLCHLAHQSGAMCPTCGGAASAFPAHEIFSALDNLFHDQSVTLALTSSEDPHHLRARFSEIIRGGIAVDMLDISGNDLLTAEPVVGVLYRGRITPERKTTIEDALSVWRDYPEGTLQVRGAQPPFPIYRHLGSRPTCPHCGNATYPLTPSSLEKAVEELRANQHESPLAWYPLLKRLLFEPAAERGDSERSCHPKITEALELLCGFGISATLATPLSELSLRERLCLRFFRAIPPTEGILLVELPSYGLSPEQAPALKKWIARQKERCAGIVALGGSELVQDAAEVVVCAPATSPSSTPEKPSDENRNQLCLLLGSTSVKDETELLSLIQSLPPQVVAVTVRQAQRLAHTVRESPETDLPWQVIDLAASLLERHGSSRPLLVALPLFRRFTTLYAHVTAARMMGITARALTLSGPQSERCEECHGVGKTIEERHAITCVRCAGSRYKPYIEQLAFRGLPFPALFTHTAEALVPLFASVLPIAQELTLLSRIGLGQIVLGTQEGDLLPDIRLRVALIVACAKSPKGRTLLLRGVSGMLSAEELTAITIHLSPLATDRGLRIIHDGARLDTLVTNS